MIKMEISKERDDSMSIFDETLVSGKKLIPKTWKKNDDFLFDFIVLFLYFNCLPWYY